MHGLEAAQELTTTLRDLRRTVKLLQSGLVILFPDETSGLQLLYSTLDRDLMQVERTSQFITHQLLIAMAETHHDIAKVTISVRKVPQPPKSGPQGVAAFGRDTAVPVASSPARPPAKARPKAPEPKSC